MIGSLGVFAEARLTDDGHSGVVRNLLQRLGEISKGVFSHCALRGEASDGPFADLDSGEELLASHVPDTLVWQCLLLAAAAVLKLGRRQNATSDLHETVADVEAELLDVGVVVEVGLSDEVVDLSFAVGGGPCSGLDHGGRLHVGQLLDAPLTLDDVADLQRQVGVFVLLADLETWQVWVAQFHLVLVEEVLGHGALDRLAVLELQREALHLRRPPRHVADAILPPHGSAVSDLDLEALDLFCELDSLRIGQRSPLVVDVPDVQHLAHEVDDWKKEPMNR